MKREAANPCSTFLGIAIFGFFAYLIYKLIRYFLSPEGLRDIFELLKALGICLGVIVLILAVMFVYFRLTPKKPAINIVKMSKDYPICCSQIEIEERLEPDNPASPYLPSGNLSVTPLYLVMTITNHGLHLAPMPSQSAWEDIPADNQERYRALSLDRSGPVILIAGFSYLYYVIYHQTSEGKVDASSGQPGDYGALPPMPEDYRIDIIMTNTTIIDVADPSIYIPRNHKIILRFAALDQNGLEVAGLTRELYEAIYAFMNPPDTSYEDYYGY